MFFPRWGNSRVNKFKFKSLHWAGDLIQFTLKRKTINPWTLTFIPSSWKESLLTSPKKNMEWEFHIGQKRHPQACTCGVIGSAKREYRGTNELSILHLWQSILCHVQRLMCSWETVIYLARSAQQSLGELHMLQVFPLVTGSQSTDISPEETPVPLWLKTVCAEPFSKEKSPTFGIQEKNINISGPWPSRGSWEKSGNRDRDISYWDIMGCRTHVWVGWPSCKTHPHSANFYNCKSCT